MSGYGAFSRVYDVLMGRVDYPKRCEYLLSVFERYGQRPKTMLDLACGTGRMTRLLAQKGLDMVGIDGSDEMLCIAREQSADFPEILWLCQDLRSLDLYGTAQGAVSTFDSLNHLTGDGDLQQFFSRLRYFLEPGNLLVFDVNSPYKHRQILGNHTFVYDLPEVYCVWQNETQELTTRITMDFFLREGQGYRRTAERFSERGYTREEIEAAASPHFALLAVYEDLSFDPPGEDSQRLIYVMKKQ